MAEYQLATPDVEGPVKRLADGAYIPADPANSDWIEYQDWLALGNTPDPFVPPVEPPPVAEDPVADVLLFDHENRIRTMEGVPPITIGDFRAKMLKRGP